MTRDLGGRIWITTEFYLRGEEAEIFRREAEKRNIDPDELIEELVSERLGELKS